MTRDFGTLVFVENVNCLDCRNGEEQNGVRVCRDTPVWNREWKFLTNKITPIASAVSGGAILVTGLS